MKRAVVIAMIAVVGLGIHVGLRWTAFVGLTSGTAANSPLFFVLAAGGMPLVWELLRKVAHGEFGSDLLAGISIVTSIVLQEYLAGAIVVLMLSGGEALEAFAVRRASSALAALAKRMPTVAHRHLAGRFEDVPLDQVQVGESLLVLPHESCPVDGTVVDGHGSMDESYLTGEPYRVAKAPGASVLSGAINGDTALTIRADAPAHDSRYAKIMKVMQDSEQRRPRFRRIGDQLGAFYTPLAVIIALAAWWLGGDARRFLAVLVVATPCPLLIAIPVAIIGSISYAARRGIIVRDPVVLERLSGCRVAILDKTGTLTYGRPDLVEISAAPGFDEHRLLALVACLERYSKHPLASAVLTAARERRVVPCEASQVSERPGEGLSGTIAGRRVRITSRKQLSADHPEEYERLPPAVAGMECIVCVDDRYAGALRFRDRPRGDSRSFIHHLGPKHHLQRVLLVSGDRESEVKYLADQVGIHEVYFGQSPEQKLEIVRRETALAPTIFIGDGINDAPALTAATVGIGMGTNNDVTTDAAGAVILESSVIKIDELLHLSARFRRIAFQSAIGGMALSVVGMGFAAAGLLPPVSGALLQELIDVLAIVNALRAAASPRVRYDVSDVDLQ